ncbi:kinase-like protein [Gigaspora margarita]|uniref:Kinase-like protein n=1 Tax=Gigaspora margarita TaxID=4874 RepID=A0A8H4B3Y6_GIGMA|nr:kinase-like protein [Gigaspora margarita]
MGVRAFDGRKFDNELATEICLGKRPQFNEGTLRNYNNLVKWCLNANPKKRPTASTICYYIKNWLDEMNNGYNYKVMSQFYEADKIKLKFKSQIHPDNMYTSKKISTNEIVNVIEKFD